jgi:hypothetical protein
MLSMLCPIPSYMLATTQSSYMLAITQSPLDDQRHAGQADSADAHFPGL